MKFTDVKLFVQNDRVDENNFLLFALEQTEENLKKINNNLHFKPNFTLIKNLFSATQ